MGFILTWYYWAFTDQLGADPVKTIIHFTGMGALNLLLLTLLVSPAARYLKQAQLVKLRRLFGLYCFTWALLHVSNYIVFDLQMAFDTLLQDIIKRPYITVGFAAFIALLALAITSNQFSQKKLNKRWHSLHKIIYPASLLIALHFIWSVKALDLEPVIYWLLLLVLLATRTRFVQRRLFT
ncbi:protein-methionine-sulfoxide reductase heme-binding subunit MsrQ [Planctobacterium marinum]|uniref:protein-methionine-sulfoxide reductase heme-binding subunit MsrQ n=1 Tax=Planctobacterium marinum TaxID=1631968 RepID=UPI0030C73F56